eukprot:CCRYP_018558-RA/>CCRYP_018558-RA protein AED:0.36 eAED:0.21 QI:0/0/0/1/1/0.83/6/0/1396
MLVGKRHPATGIWVVPTHSHPISTKPPSAFASHAAHNAYQTTSKAKLIQFLHQCAFSPPPSTWIKAINNNQFATWPGLTADAVRRYLPDSTATAKGHMKKTPAGVRSTRTTPTPTIHRPPSTSPPSPPPNYEDLFPPQEPNTINHIFCWAALADQIDGTTYTDLTGRFPTMSLENKQYIFVAYDYTTNAIIVRAITDRESSTIVKACRFFGDHLPKVTIIDHKYKIPCDLPTESPIEAAARTAAELLIELRQQRDPQDPTQLSRHQRAIKIINDIYQLNSRQAPRVNTQTAPPPRVEPTLSSNPTAPRILRATPRLHTRVTRRNTPGLTTVPTTPRRSPRLNPNIPNTSVETAPTPPSQLPSPVLTGTTPVAPPRPVQPHPPTPRDNDHHTSSSPTPTFTDEDDVSVVIPVSSIPMEKHPPVHVQIPHFISQDALHAFAYHASTPSTSNLFLPKWRQPTAIPHLEHFANPVVHPTSGKTLLGALAQGDNKTGAAGTNTIFFLDHTDILNIPSDRTITYARVVVDYRRQKEDPNQVRITVGGNLIDYPGELTTRTADLVTSKILWNSIISTPSARYLTADLKLFYLTAPLDRYEYMRIPLKIIPSHIIDQYDLRAKAKNGFVYMEIRRAMYGLPQAGILANKLLRQRLAKYGYYKVAHTPGLWKHLSRPISFTLVVDDFGINNPDITRIQQIVGAILYYARCVDITILKTLSTIAHKQARATERTNLSITQLLDYCATHPDATIHFRASDMVLNIHSDASYLNAPSARSRIGGHFFLGWAPRDHLPIKLNGAIHVISTILKFVAASASEAELGALFVNAKEGRILRLILQELGHPQPPTPIHCDNSTAAGIANNTVKRQRSRSMEMRYFWIADQVARKQFSVHWHPGLENMGINLGQTLASNVKRAAQRLTSTKHVHFARTHTVRRFHQDHVPTVLATYDSGADGHYISERDRAAANLPILRPSTKRVGVANGNTCSAKHVTALPFPNLSPAATRADTFDQFPTSLISVGRLSDDNTVSIFTKMVSPSIARPACSSHAKECPFLLGSVTTKGPTAFLSSNSAANGNHAPPARVNKALQQANSVYDLPSVEQAIRWMHAVCGYPVKSTWIKAIKAGNFVGWPLLTEKNVAKYYPDTGETPKGTSIRPARMSAQPNTTLHHSSKPTAPPCAGRSRGNKYVMVMVEVDSNVILLEPMHSRKDNEMIRAYDSLVKRLLHAGVTPRKHVLDNEISLNMKDHIKDTYKFEVELVPPGCHRRNAAEVAIRNFKSHFLSILAGVDTTFPPSLWDRLLPQTEITLNLLRQSNATPTVSAYAHLCGPFNYNKMPLAPMGCAVQVHEKADKRGTWASHCIDGWYLNTSAEHYRVHNCHIKSTKAERLSDTVHFKHKDITNPSLPQATS